MSGNQSIDLPTCARCSESAWYRTDEGDLCYADYIAVTRRSEQDPPSSA